MIVELHLLPDSQKNSNDEEDDRPVAELFLGINAGVKRREIVKDFFLELAPHVCHGTFDLKVDHDWSCNLVVKFGVAIVDAAFKLLFLWDALDHGNMVRQIVSQQHLQGFADNRALVTHPESMRRLEHLCDVRSALEVLVDKFGEAHLDVLVEVDR